ncbi:hypothetical protein HDU85_006781 [Gaertneriomyces sp. JEL0708]|nr:hypothetical protein HDU85_006781 [Gaertneriomyces sp. JEL0708]
MLASSRTEHEELRGAPRQRRASSTSSLVSEESAISALDVGRLLRIQRSTASTGEATKTVAENEEPVEKRGAGRERREGKQSCRRTLQGYLNHQTKRQLIERELEALTTKPTVYDDIAHTIGDLERSFYDEQKTLEQAVYKKVASIRSSVRSLCELVGHPEPGHTYIERLKRTMSDIERDLLLFKNAESTSFEELQVRERQLTRDIASANAKMEAWETIVNEPPSQEGRKKAIRQKPSHLYNGDGLLPDVVAYQNYLARYGGHTGGWDEQMHRVWLKLRQSYEARYDEFLRACVARIPGISLEEAIVHEEWYTGFCEVTDAKKRAIERWRKRKEELAAKSSSETGKAGHAEDATARAVQNERDQQEREQKKREVEEWKARKHAEQENAERRKREKERRQQDEQQGWREKQAMRRTQVAAEASRRREREERIKAEREAHEQLQKRLWSETSKLQAERLAQKNADLLHRRHALLEKQQQAEEEKQRRLERLKELFKPPEVEKDPARVLRSTQAFQHKREKGELEQTEAVRCKFTPAALPRRHVPLWRQGM